MASDPFTITSGLFDGFIPMYFHERLNEIKPTMELNLEGGVKLNYPSGKKNSTLILGEWIGRLESRTMAETKKREEGTRRRGDGQEEEGERRRVRGGEL